MVKQISKLLFVGVLVSGFLSTVPIAEAHRDAYNQLTSDQIYNDQDAVDQAADTDFRAHQRIGLENTKDGLCSKDWCTRDEGGGNLPIELFCDPQPFPDACTDALTYCQHNKDDRDYSIADAHGKIVAKDDQAGCAAILAGAASAGTAAASAATLSSSRSAADDTAKLLTDTIAALNAGNSGQDTPAIKAARGKLDAAMQFFVQGDQAKDTKPDVAKIRFDKAAQLANEGLQLLGAAPADGSGSGSGSSGSSGSPTPSRTITGPGLVTPASGIQGISGLTTAEELAVGIINFILSFVGIIAVAMLIYGGFLYITAAGDPAKSGKGRSVIVGAVIGILIIIGSWTIVNTVINLQGGSGGSGGGRTAIVKSVQVTISGTTLLGANVRGTVTVFQGDTVNAQLSSDTAGGFIRNTAEIEVTLDKATLLIGGQGGATLPARDAQQVDIPSVGSLRKGKVDITVLQ